MVLKNLFMGYKFVIPVNLLVFGEYLKVREILCICVIIWVKPFYIILVLRRFLPRRYEGSCIIYRFE